MFDVQIMEKFRTIVESHKVELILLSGSLGGVILTEQDLSFLTDTLRAAASMWWDIGDTLGILDSDLTIIQHNPLLIVESPTGYFREMLSHWLKWAPPSHWPTVEALTVALQRNGHEDLAAKLNTLKQH